MECLDSAPADVGVVFFAYDWVSGVFTKASQAAPWDPAMPQYGSDCDRYRRIRLAGYRTIDCQVPIGTILHLHSPLSSENLETLYDSGMNTTEQREFVDRLQQEAAQYAWREGGKFDALSEIDRAAAAAEGDGGKGYFEAKWGAPFTCEIDDRTPKFDLPLP